jgi:hypothetical protein
MKLSLSHPLLSLSLLSAITSCAASDGDGKGTGTSTPAAEPVPPSGGTLRVVVRAGTASASNSAPLVVAPYASCPPAGPPVGLKFVRVESPTLPATADLTGLPPGRYHVLAYRGAGMQPTASDPQVCSPADVAIGTAVGATIEVVLP